MIEMLFLAKKILSAWLMPLPFGFLLLAIAALFYVRHSKRFAKILAFGVLLFWYILSLWPVSKLVAAPLEFQFPKYASQKVAYVLVLGGYHRSDDRKPVTSLLSPSSLMRLTEGIRIYHLNPGSKLLLSGYKARDQLSNAEAMAKVAVIFGVPSDDIVLATRVKDTSEEAAYWAHYIEAQKSMVSSAVKQDEALALVTSATHMPRAVFLFNQYRKLLNNTQVVPAPTVYYSSGHQDLYWESFFPSAAALRVTEIAWHEYLGYLWAYLK